jgi:hypothetical protein
MDILKDRKMKSKKKYYQKKRNFNFEKKEFERASIDLTNDEHQKIRDSYESLNLAISNVLTKGSSADSKPQITTGVTGTVNWG